MGTRTQRDAWALPARAAALALLALAACTPAPRPDVVLITVDTLRSDHVSAYGYARDTSPQLAAFSETGARFDLAYAPMSATHPSHVTIFTGQYPLTHGVVKNGTPLPDESVTLAETLRAHGYETAAFVSSFVLDERFGLSQGFERYDDDFAGADASMRLGRFEGHEVETFDRRAEETTRRAVRWLEEERDVERPLFLFVHYFDPHAPYAPPGAHGLRFSEHGVDRHEVEINLYDAEIAYTDGQIGELLAALDRLGPSGETLTVITSDHGEGLWDHGHRLHGVHIYEEQVRIPLLVRWRGVVPEGLVIEPPVGLIDLAPTILDLLDLDAGSAAFAGTSLAPALRGEAPLAHRPVHLHREPYESGIVDGVRVSGDQHAIREGRWKYIEGPALGTRELFDLERDPAERENLYYTEPARAEHLRERLEQWRREYAGRVLAPGFAEQDREGLEALGYVE